MPEPVAILRALGVTGARDITPVSGGADALIWRVTTGDGAYALRLLEADRHEQARRENGYLAWAVANGIPGPEIIAQGKIEGQPATLMTWIDGEPLSHALFGGNLDPVRALALFQSFGAILRRIHDLPPPPQDAPVAIPWNRFVDTDLRNALASVPSPPSSGLHLDYHPLNVMVKDGEIVAVLDWANAAISDPRFDVARTRSILALAPIPDPDMAPLLDQALQAFHAGYGAPAPPAVFDWWAGTVMQHDLAPRVGRPDIPWLTPAYMTRVTTWTNEGRERAANP